MTAQVNLKLRANGKTSNDGISFTFDTFSGAVTPEGHVTMTKGDAEGLVFDIFLSQFQWSEAPDLGVFEATFATDGSGIYVFSDSQKVTAVPLDGTGVFGKPIISKGGKTLTLPNKNSAIETYYYALGISINGRTTRFKLDPMIRNTGPRNFIEQLTQPVVWVLNKTWALLGYPYRTYRF